MEQYLQRASMNDDFNETANLKSAGTTLSEQEMNPSIGFECNICLDLVRDPVVTFCGHLYCWPCIYRWISFQETSPENPDHQNPQCPVCKAEVSEKTLIPLYGRGEPTSLSKDKLSHLIPHRPSSPTRAENVFSPNNRNSSNRSNPFHTGSYMATPMLGHGGSSTHLADPMIGMFGEMVYARIFGNSETTLYTYPNSYHLAGSNTPRLRRRMMQTDRSLGRVCFFLFCCMMLCLLLF